METGGRPGPGAEIGRVIRQKRLSAGLSGRQLAERAGVSNTAVSELETGKRSHPWVDVVGRLARALHTTTDDLLREAGVDVSPGIGGDLGLLYEALGERERQAWLEVGRIIRELQSAYHTPPAWRPTIVEPLAGSEGGYLPDRRRIAEAGENWEEGNGDGEEDPAQD